MLLEEAKIVVDMLKRAKRIQQYLGESTLADDSLDPIVRDAVYLNFIVIGEVLNSSKKFGDLLMGRITESHRIIGFRNQIAHGYAHLKHDWTDRTIQEKLPILIAELEELLREVPPLR